MTCIVVEIAPATWAPQGEEWGTATVFAERPTDIRPGQERVFESQEAYEAACAARGEQPRYHPNAPAGLLY